MNSKIEKGYSGRNQLLPPAEQLVMILDRIYRCGMTTTSGGNLSLLDSNGDIWITPTGIDKGSLTSADIVRVKPDGTIIGKYQPSCELPFHRLIYQNRPDVKAIVHAHPPALVSFSIVRKIPQTKLIPDVEFICGEIKMAEYALPGSIDLGNKIAAAFTSGVNIVMLENHGVVVAGTDIFEAFMAFETLEFSAQMEINAYQIGQPVSLNTTEIEKVGQTRKAVTQMSEFVPQSHSSEERQARKEMVDFIHRAYDQKLISSTQGTFSIRLNEHSFIITPEMVDRKYLTVNQIVRIDEETKEAGKIPSTSVWLHKRIYDRDPDVHSIIDAYPPNIGAFAVTKEGFDSRTIPESYIVLRNVRKAPFEPDWIQFDLKTFTKENPIAMVENRCIIVTGNSPLKAFDRLEVAESTAKTIIAARRIGKIVSIKQDQVTEIEGAFPL
jgi:L-fuculose-phosphate aldolase